MCADNNIYIDGSQLYPLQYDYICSRTTHIGDKTIIVCDNIHKDAMIDLENTYQRKIGVFSNIYN